MNIPFATQKFEVLSEFLGFYVGRFTPDTIISPST